MFLYINKRKGPSLFNKQKIKAIKSIEKKEEKGRNKKKKRERKRELI